MKRLFSKKKLLYIIVILIFFTIFKYIKGKSFLDTFWEYTNNIKSINSEIINVSKENLKDIKGYYIPTKYAEYIKYTDNKYITKVDEQEKNDIYIYDIKTGEETIFEYIEEGNIVRDIKVSEKYIIWLESKEVKKDGKDFINWEIKVKSDGEKCIVIDTGEFIIKDGSDYNINFPDSFSLDKSNLVYRRYKLDVKSKNNITVEKNIIEIVYKNLESKKEEVLASSNDIDRNNVYNPKIDKNKIVWEKAYKMAEEENISNTEVYMYDIEKENIEKIYTANKILDIDIKDNNVVMLIENPEPNIVIYKIDDLSMVNIIYKGSKAYKKISDNGNEFAITDVEFIDDNNIIIKISNLINEYNDIIYNLKEESLTNLTPTFATNSESTLNYSVNDKILNIFVGIEGFENKNIEDQIDYYYKNYVCTFN